jgi:hypothetical protein
MTQSKLCYKCKNEKPITEFNRSQYDKGGFRNICRDCRNTHRAIVRSAEKNRQTLFQKQNGCCAICGKTEKDNGQQLAIDHNHSTHQVRALLCRHCNTGLGAFKDDEVLMSKAIEYLREWGGYATT